MLAESIVNGFFFGIVVAIAIQQEGARPEQEEKIAHSKHSRRYENRTWYIPISSCLCMARSCSRRILAHLAKLSCADVAAISRLRRTTSARRWVCWLCRHLGDWEEEEEEGGRVGGRCRGSIAGGEIWY